MMKVPAGFARLLATENIMVRLDPSAPTASFDVENRVLTMPNWDASEHLRDMLIGHEVAHAIFSTGDLMEHVRNVGSSFAIAKDYLNVVEDARIDRLIQRRYAGLRRDYAVGYREMIEKDFFGIGDVDPASMNLLDRINLHFKHYEGIEFAADEQAFVDRIDRIETIEEAVEVARDLYNYCASLESEQDEQQDGSAPAEAPVMEGDEGDAGSNGMNENADSDQDGDSSDDAGEAKAEGGDSPDVAGDSPAGVGEGETDADGPAAAGEKGGREHGNVPAGSETLRAMEKSVEDMADRTTDIHTYRIPEANLDRIIITHDEILGMDRRGGRTMNSATEDFIGNSRTTVSNLAMLFERKKAGAINARTQIAKTGRLDMTALHKYKMTEDIFLRNRVEMKGKNHGMIIFVDWSGSMGDCMSETIQQTIVMAMFCKKVGIPFRIYGFTTYVRGSAHAWNNDPRDTHWNVNHEGNTGIRDLNVTTFSLLELFTDRMKKTAFDEMVNLLLTSAAGGMYYNTPVCLGLGGTPLNEAILAGIPVAERFRKENRTDILNTIFITDGEGNNVIDAYGDIVINDQKTGRVYDFGRASRYGSGWALDIYKDRIGGNLIGFYLTSKKAALRDIYYNAPNGQSDRLQEQFKKSSYVSMPKNGYDTYFLMDKKIAFYTGSDAMDSIGDDASLTKAINAFRKDLGNRNASRPMLNELTDRICKEMV